MRYTIPYSIIRTKSYSSDLGTSDRVDESTANYETQVQTTVLHLPLIVSQSQAPLGDSDISFADSSTLSRAREGWLVVPNIFFTPRKAVLVLSRKGCPRIHLNFVEGVSLVEINKKFILKLSKPVLQLDKPEAVTVSMGATGVLFDNK
jgi:hypothetical protein